MDHASSHLVSGLVVLGSGPEAGRRLPLTNGRHLIGRDLQNDLRLDDLTVSRRHAAITVTNEGAWIEDLGSTGGTRVNHDVVTGRRLVRPGDRIELGSLSLRLDPEASGAATATLPVATENPSSRQDIGSQYDGSFYNAARDQHISYVQQIQREREPFLREIAATRTKARGLIWLGVLISVVGYGWTLVIIGGSFSMLTEAMSSESFDEGMFRNYFGPPILGVPSAVWAVGLSAAGTVLLIVGALLHITATARRRRVDRQLPLRRSEP